MVIDRLRQDLAANKSHIQAMSRKLDRVYSEVESKCKNWQAPDVCFKFVFVLLAYIYCLPNGNHSIDEVEVQDLKACLLMEQEEKIDITNRLQSLQKERKSFFSLLTQCLKKTNCRSLYILCSYYK